MWLVHKMEYYSLFRKKGVLAYVITYINIMISEISQL